MESNSFEKTKVIASLPILRPNFRFVFLKISQKSRKPGHGNLVLITLAVQVELSKWNFNFDNIRINFLPILTF